MDSWRSTCQETFLCNSLDGVRTAVVVQTPTVPDLNTPKEYLETGKITPVIDRTYPRARSPRRCGTSEPSTPGERSSLPRGSCIRRNASPRSPRHLRIGNAAPCMQT